MTDGGADARASGDGPSDGPARSPADGPGPSPPEPEDGTAAHPERFFCDLCGHEMLNRHCKLLCLQCGYQRDCSDP